MITLRRLQAEVYVWSLKNFPDKKQYQPLLGVAEEVGELCHAHLKTEQGIRGDAKKHYDDSVDAVGDIIIYLADYCAQNNIDFEMAVYNTWEKVKKRDWQVDKQNGGDK